MLYPDASHLLSPWSTLTCPRERWEVTSGLYHFSSKYWHLSQCFPVLIGQFPKSQIKLNGFIELEAPRGRLIPSIAHSVSGWYGQANKWLSPHSWLWVVLGGHSSEVNPWAFASGPTPPPFCPLTFPGWGLIHTPEHLPIKSTHWLTQSRVFLFWDLVEIKILFCLGK